MPYCPAGWKFVAVALTLRFAEALAASPYSVVSMSMLAMEVPDQSVFVIVSFAQFHNRVTNGDGKAHLFLKVSGVK